MGDKGGQAGARPDVGDRGTPDDRVVGEEGQKEDTLQLLDKLKSLTASESRCPLRTSDDAHNLQMD